jgi:hypothetical protein
MIDLRSSLVRRGAVTLLSRDVATVACGAVTMVAASLSLAMHTSSAVLHQVWIGFVPVGAIATGACAASGYYLGARAGGRRPPAFAVTLMRASILPVYAAASFLSSRSDTLHAVSLDPSGVNSAAVTGPLLLPLVVLAGLGFAVGAVAVIGLLDAPVHCHSCRRYLRRPAWRTDIWPAGEFERNDRLSLRPVRPWRLPRLATARPSSICAAGHAAGKVTGRTKTSIVELVAEARPEVGDGWSRPVDREQALRAYLRCALAKQIVDGIKTARRRTIEPW